MAAYDLDCGLHSVTGAIAGTPLSYLIHTTIVTENIMDIIQGHNNITITMMLHNIHTDLVATGNASTTWTPPKAKVSVNVVKHHCYINMNILCP